MRRLTGWVLLRGLLVVLLLCATGATLVSPVAAREYLADDVVHQVGWGENLHRIANHFGVTVEAIVAANGLDGPDRIYVGQKLVIPVAGSSGGEAAAPTAARPATHVVQPGENLFRIGLRYGLTTDQLAAANGMTRSSTLYAGQTLQIPDGTGVPTGPYGPEQVTTTHVVAPGETLASLSRQYGVTVNALMQVNNIGNASVLYAGQTLTIPDSGALSAPAGATGGVGKRIHVDLSEQRTYVFQNGQLVWTFVVSTGLPGQDTWTGTFHVQNKLPEAYASTWNLRMPHWLGIYWAGSLQNGFHALPILANGQRLWAGVLGSPVSYGCIVLGVEDAERLYNWAEVGTEVTIVP